MQSRNHGARRNAKRLNHKRAQHKHHQKHRKQAGGPVEPPRLAQPLPGLGRGLRVGHHTGAGRALLARLPLRHGLGQGTPALRQKQQFFGHPIATRNQYRQHQHRGKVAHQPTHVPRGQIRHQGGKQHRRDGSHGLLHQSSTCKIAKNASCGTSTVPICFMRFLPAFCFSSSLRLRVMSPP